jgi:uncharacterized protein YbjQ (UPF0145 family)
MDSKNYVCTEILSCYSCVHDFNNVCSVKIIINNNSLFFSRSIYFVLVIHNYCTTSSKMGNSVGGESVRGGVLQSAFTPPLDGVELPQQLANKKTIKFKVPKGKKGGDTITVMNGQTPIKVKIPEGIVSGDTCTASVKEAKQDICKKVYASTMQMIPGMVVVSAKPIIYGTAIKSYYRGNSDSNLGLFTQAISKLMEDANAKILDQAIDCGCNAVLGMAFNLSNDTMGESGTQLVIVTVCGTPCIVVNSGALPTVATGASIVNYDFSTPDIVAATVMVEPTLSGPPSQWG